MEKVERVAGIEPACAAWKAAVLPLNYTRSAGHPSDQWPKVNGMLGTQKGQPKLPFLVVSRIRMLKEYLYVSDCVTDLKQSKVRANFLQT